MKKKKLLLLSLASIMTASLFLSCNNGSSTDAAVQNRIDSLTNLAKDQQTHIGEMEDFITSLSLTMDSIDMQEKELVGEGDYEKRKARDKASVIAGLKRYKAIIDRQKQQIAHLQQQLAAKNDEMSSKMLQIVEFYKKALEEKDGIIASLQSDIEKNKKVITNLQTSVDNLISTTLKQSGVIKEQEGILTTQTNMINTCYVRIGTKKELKQAGILSGGFLKKSKLDASKLLPGNFTEMDMRRCNDIELASSDPKVLTQMPASSYEIIKNDKGTSYLHIKDPNAFWSVSKYLVIQL